MASARHAPGTATFARFARILGGCSPSYVTQLKDAGRLVLTDDGKRVRVQESIALVESTRDPGKVGVAARHAAARGKGGAGTAPVASLPATPPPVAQEPDPEDPAAPTEYDGHSTRRGRALADKAEWDAKVSKRDYEISMGQLLQADQVATAVTGAATTLRTALENLPNTLAPELAATTDEARVRVILGEAIEHALEEISRQFAAIAKQAPA